MKNRILQLKRVAFALLVLLLNVAGVKTTNAQNTVGTDFWVTFLPNYETDADHPLTLSLIATASSPCSGTITNPYTGWSTGFEVSVGATTIIDIPASEAYSDDDSDDVVNIGLHVVSTEPISLFASNFRPFTFDVTDVLPTYSLGSNYIIQTYNESSRSIAMNPSSQTNNRFDGSCSEFTVLAVEDNTTVYITLADNSMNGHYANQTFSVTLNAGQCYQIKSVIGGDFSGSQVSVSGNKKVAVFAGNRCTNVPYNCGYCDHIVEQMMPVSCWGNHFVVTNSAMRTFDVVRVTAENNGCQIFINNSLVTTIDQKQTYQFEINSDNPSLYLETSEPAMVYLYYVGSECAGENGDPSMVMISPIEQRMNYVTFSTFNSGASQYHFVNIITDTEDASSVQLDGYSIASEFQTVSGNTGYSFARVQIEHGSHTLLTTGGGFVAHVYGLGDDESYAYSVGSNAIQELFTNMLVNGQTVSDDMDVCGKTVSFDLNYNYNVSQVNWTFGDGQTGSGIPFTHEYANVGDYPVSCDVYKLDSYGQDSLVATMSTVLHIYDSYETELSVTSYRPYSWMGQTYSSSGDYVYEGQTIHGCDSIITLHLTIPTLQVIAEYYPDVDNPHSQYARVYWNEFTGGAPFEAQIGEGTNTFSYFPFYTYYNYSIAENLFLASELEEAGVTTSPMTSLSWYATNAPGYAQQGISIWMANVDDTELTSTSHIVSDMTLVYTGAMTPVIGWNEFVFNEGTFAWDGHSNILIYCQRNNGSWNTGVSWEATSSLPFTASTYKYQDSSAFDPTIANSMSTSTTRPNIIMKSDGNRTENLTYCIYRANCDDSGIQMIADNVTENQYIDSEWSGLYPGSYRYGVSVVDGRGNANEIQWNNTSVTPNHHTLDASAFLNPVTNNSHYGELRVNCENGRHNNDVTINTGDRNNRDYLQYCTDNYAGGVGTGGGAVYWGNRFPAADLTAYAGQSLTKVGIFTDTDGDYGWTYSGTYTVNVYLGGDNAPGTLVSSVSEYVSGDFAWHDITLTTPVTIDATQDLWLTIYTPDIAYPMSGCDYVGNSNSDFLSLDGFTWEHSADYGLNYTWMIRGYVEESGSEIFWSNCLWKPGNTINPQSTIGNDFWVTFLPNNDGSVNLSLIATGSSPCTGTVTNPYTNWTTEFEVSVGATTIINIPSNEAFSNGASDCVLNTSLHIVTSDFISLYASNFQEFTFDVTDVLPTPSLGSNYIIQTYPGEEGRGAMVQPSSDSRSLAQGCSEFAVIAVEDNTTVYITLTCDSQNGHYANQPFSVTLNTGECYQVKSITDGNLSGSQISVSGNKKIAVFAGNSCANVPTNCPYCDHIVEQMLPVSSWGNHFVVTGSSMRTYDIVRVTAASDDCQIFINNSLVTTINERETYQFEISSDDPSLYLETSKPAMVYLYYVGSECAGQMGDPSMVIISPIEQRMDYVTFSTFNSGASQYHFVNVITNTDDVNTVLLDGNNIASQFQTVSGNSGYSFARISIEHGSHTLFTLGSGFVAHVYGLGDDESYAYSVGSNAAQELYTNMLVNGQTASDNMDVCNQTVNFDLNYNYNVSQVNWTFGDGQTGSGIPITHEYANLGDYPVSCDVYKLDGNGNDSLVGTFSTILHIYESYYTEFEVTAHNYYTWEWMGETYYESGDYSYYGQTIHGCDSIVTLHLTITHEITVTANPEAGGTVVGGGMYNQGQDCTLSATANAGYDFLCWVDLNGAVISLEPEYTFAVTEDMTFTAYFAAEGYCGIKFDLYDSYGDGWTSNYLVVNFGNGTSQELTLNNGYSTSYILPIADGSHVTLNWISGSYIGECTYTLSYLNGNEIFYGYNMSDNFQFDFDMDCEGMPATPYFYIDVTANPYQGGSVNGGGSYQKGLTHTITASAYDGYAFVNWTKNGTEVSTEESYSFIVTENADFVANFQAISYQITVTANPAEGGTANGGGTYYYGETCNLTATANNGYMFAYWSDEANQVISMEPDYSFTVTEEKTFVARFVEEGSLCSIIFDLYDSYGDGWNGNQLVLNFDDGTTQQVTLNDGSYASETLFLENGSHIVLTWISGYYIDECSFTMSYSDGTVIYEGTNLDGTTFEFIVNCGGSSNITQTTNFVQGWNWWSTYIEQEGINGLTMLEQGLGSNGYQIKSQTDYVTNYGSSWMGTLNSINNEETYMLNNTADCQVVLTGPSVSPTDHPITIHSGWNWIGYPCANTMSVTDAFAGYTPANNDQLKSQYGYAMYYSGMWIGRLQNITPGTGLLYLSNNGSTNTLIYPEGGRSTEIITSPSASHWTNDVHTYPNNMTVLTVVELDDEELATDNYELSAFDANGECRGSVKLTYVEPLNRQVAFLTIAGDEAEELSFALYDSETGFECFDSDSRIVYVTNATIGNPEDPFVIRFRSTTGIDEIGNNIQIFPNPAQVGERINILTNADGKQPIHVEIVDVLGTTVSYQTFTETPASFVTPMTAGVYMLRIHIDGSGTYCKKLIIK